MADRYPFLAFTFKGRIKSLIRLEEKINGNIVEYIYEHHVKTGAYPSETEIKEQIGRIRDLIAYRIVLSLPECHVKEGEDKNARELELLYEIANDLPGFLEERGFNAEIGPANHLGYEKRQEKERRKRAEVPAGENIYFDNAYERGMILQNIKTLYKLNKCDIISI